MLAIHIINEVTYITIVIRSYHLYYYNYLLTCVGHVIVSLVELSHSTAADAAAAPTITTTIIVILSIKSKSVTLLSLFVNFIVLYFLEIAFENIFTL